MTWRWGNVAAGLLAAAAARPLPAQVSREIGVQAIFAAQEPTLLTGGLHAALRTARRGRLAATAGAGRAGDDFVVRGELIGHFLLNPSATRRPGVYAGGGVAVVAGSGEQGYVVLLVGIEGSPGGRSGWALEAGLGGGIRVSAGWRWRWRRAAPTKP